VHTLARGASRSIAWLRGDPAALRLAAEARGLLGIQGLALYIPGGLGPVRADVVVEPLPGTPEWRAYSTVEVMARYRVSHPDPLTALALAVAAPRRGFSRLLLGVDPGGTCAGSLVGDSLLLSVFRAPCASLGEKALDASKRIPAGRFEVIVGSGPGFEEAASSLARAGVPFRVADESWTTSRPSLWVPLQALGDRDIAAAATIALLAAAGRGGGRTVHR